MSTVAYVVTHITDAQAPIDRSETIVTVSLSLDLARKFVEKTYIPRIQNAVRKEWAGSDEQVIESYVPKFSEDKDLPNRYTSNDLNQMIIIDEFDVLQSD